MFFVWTFLAICGGVGLGFMLAGILGLGGKADLELQAMRERSRADLAYTVGDMMCACLTDQLKRRDLGIKTRHHIGDLLFRWGALRPVTPTGTPPPVAPSDFLYSRATATGCTPPGTVLRASATEAGAAIPTSQRLGEEVV